MRWVKFDPDLTTFIPNVSTKVNISGADLSAVDPFKESIDLVKRIADTYPEPYTLLVSGGIDSQSMLLAWKNSGVEFKAVSYTFNQHFNEHDLFWLKKFCQYHSIAIEYRDIDIFTFLKTKHSDYAIKYISNSPLMNCYIEMASLINEGTVITSGSSPTQEGLSVNYSILALERYRRIENKNYIPFFFQEDTRVAGAFMNKAFEIQREPVCAHLLGYGFKTYLYYASGFDLLPSYKISGFEKYKSFYDNFYNSIPSWAKLKYAKYPSKRAFDYLFRYPNFDINSYVDDLQYYFKHGISK